MKKIIYKILRSVGSEGSKAKWTLKYHVLQGLSIGEGSHYFSDILIGEPYLVSIGKNCTISANVCFLTHDASIGALNGRNISSDICGRIEIGDNCFIGYGSVILCGVTIPNRVIVAAGSVVTKSIDCSDVIVGGNPAKVICSTKEFINKRENNFLCLHHKTFEERKQIILSNQNKLVKK